MGQKPKELSLHICLFSYVESFYACKDGSSGHRVGNKDARGMSRGEGRAAGPGKLLQEGLGRQQGLYQGTTKQAGNEGICRQERASVSLRAFVFFAGGWGGWVGGCAGGRERERDSFTLTEGPGGGYNCSHLLSHVFYVYTAVFDMTLPEGSFLFATGARIEA